MAKKIKGAGEGSRVQAEPWLEGKLIVGFFLSSDTLPDCESRKLTFDLGDGTLAAVWETAALARQVKEMQLSQFYRIKCLGKSITTKAGNKAWGFEVEQSETAEELAAWTAEYRAYVAGGGR